MSNSVHRFNHIYKELVPEPNNLVGLLAYAVYKQEKIDYIVRFMSDNNGKRPTPEDLKEFHRMSMGRCDQYRMVAEIHMETFQKEIHNDIIPELDKQYGEQLQSELKRMKPSKWTGVWQSAAGSILFTMGLGLLVVLILGVRYVVSVILQEATRMFMGQ